MPSNINDRIRILMHFKQLTATQLAEIIHVQRSSVSHILSGRNKPSLDFVQKIVEQFPEVSYDWLINGKGSIKSNSNDTNVTNSNTQKDTFVTYSDSHTSQQNITNVTPIHSSEGDNLPTQNQIVEVSSDKSAVPSKKIIRIVMFYEDGTFESFDTSS